MNNKTVFIGAGHGASDPGAVNGNYTEAGLMTELRNLVWSKVIAAGIVATTDGAGNQNLPLRESIKLARAANIAVELHLNAGPVKATGVECLSLPVHKKLAQDLAFAIAVTLGIPPRGDKGWKSDDSGQHHRLGFCREGNGVIAECFFISNPGELQKYLNDRDAVATVIADVLIAHARGE